MSEAGPMIARDPNVPQLDFETRPSRVTGLSWFAVLRYKEIAFESPLPLDLPNLIDDPIRYAAEVTPVINGLMDRLKPILVREDEERCQKVGEGLTTAKDEHALFGGPHG